MRVYDYFGYYIFICRNSTLLKLVMDIISSKNPNVDFLCPFSSLFFSLHEKKQSFSSVIRQKYRKNEFNFFVVQVSIVFRVMDWLTVANMFRTYFKNKPKDLLYAMRKWKDFSSSKKITYGCLSYRRRRRRHRNLFRLLCKIRSFLAVDASVA